MKEGMVTFSLTVPTFNERDNLPLLVRRVDRGLSEKGIDYEVVVVDDSSPDGTWKVALDLARHFNVRVIRRREKNGLSSAILTGFRHSRGRILGVMDADLQHPPELLPCLVEKVQNGTDIAIASRWVDGGRVLGWGRLRRLVSKGAESLARLMVSSVRRVHDPLSGFFVMKREVLNGGIDHPMGYKILLDILVHTQGSVISEVPYTFHNRRNGESKLSAGEYFTYIKHLLMLSIAEHRRGPRGAPSKAKPKRQVIRIPPN